LDDTGVSKLSAKDFFFFKVDYSFKYEARGETTIQWIWEWTKSIDIEGGTWAWAKSRHKAITKSWQ